MGDLVIEVKDGDIVVSSPGLGYCIIYRRVRQEPMLMALEPMRDDPDSEAAEFLVQAWKAAYAKAKELGWL
jgi:hypothetical protein